MEVESCMKAVVLAANQYCNNSLPESHQIHLQRHLDILVSLAAQGKCVGLFQEDQMLPTDCFVALTEVLNNSSTNTSVAEKVLSLLTHLVKDEEVRKVLHSSFNITSSLASLLKSYDLSHAMAAECVKLMQQITYKCHISYHETYVEDLLWWLIKKINSSDHVFTQPGLGLLANLCRENFSVQMSIKNMDGFRSFCRTLVGKLSQSDHTVAVFSMSILASLCLNDKIGGAVFQSENLHQTFQLMFTIVNGNNNTSRRYGVDLFGDLLNDSKIQNTLLSFKGLGPALEKIFSLLSSANPDVVAKLLELLLLFCRVNGLRAKVCRVFVQSLQSSGDGHSFHLVLQWAAQSLEIHQTVPLLALDFLREMYEEAIDLNLLTSFGKIAEEVLSLAKGTLFRSENGNRAHQSKIERTLRLLLVLCNDDGLRVQVGRVVNGDVCTSLIEEQMNLNYIISSNTLSPSNARELQADIVVYCLQLMVKLAHGNAGLGSSLRALLQDSRLVPFLSFGIKSTKMERVHVSLKLLAIALQLESFPLAMLADNIAVGNSDTGTQKRKASERPGYGETSVKEERVLKPLSVSGPRSDNLVSTNSTLNCTASTGNSTDQDASIQNLINQMRKGLEINNVKTSDILNVYEHRLQSLETKENHLQDLLDAKTLALSQADRVISQYRCRCAQVTAENTKLCGLLRDYESVSEDSREKLRHLETEKDQLHLKLHQVEEDNKRLEEIAEDHDELMEKFTEQTKRLENSQRSLTTLKQKHESLTEMHEMLRRHNETLKHQSDVASQQITELEEKLRTTSSLLKEKEQKVQELKNSLMKSESSLSATSKERDELEVAIDSLRETLAKTQGDLKKLHHEVKTLEILCRQHEETIQEKENVVRNQKATLDKQAHIKNVIQGLFNGDPNSLGLGN